jgi:hypothetical protein
MMRILPPSGDHWGSDTNRSEIPTDSARAPACRARRRGRWRAVGSRSGRGQTQSDHLLQEKSQQPPTASARCRLELARREAGRCAMCTSTVAGAQETNHRGRRRSHDLADPRRVHPHRASERKLGVGGAGGIGKFPRFVPNGCLSVGRTPVQKPAGQVDVGESLTVCAGRCVVWRCGRYPSQPVGGPPEEPQTMGGHAAMRTPHQGLFALLGT